MSFRIVTVVAFMNMLLLRCCVNCGPHPGILVSPTALTFAAQVDSPSAPAGITQTITVASSGFEDALIINAISISGGFSQTNDCPISPNTLPVGSQCTVKVAFAPNEVGVINGALTFTTNASNPTVTLSGTGVAPAGFSVASLDFGSVASNTSSSPQSVTLTNNQTGNLKINSISTTGDYSPTPSGTCSATLAAGASCTINVTFTPTINGSIPGALIVATDATPEAQPVALTGTGTGSVSVPVSFSPTSLDFGDQEAGRSSQSKDITVTNTSNTSSTSFTISASANYSETDDCAGNLPASASCTIHVVFNPAADFVPVSYPGAITVTDGALLQVVGLSGTGVAPVSSSPFQVTFPTFQAGLGPAEQNITLTNNDASAQSVSLSSLGPFTIDSANNNCPASMPPGSQCKFGVNSNGGTGQMSGAIEVTESTPGFLNPQVVALSACGTNTVLTPQSLNFGGRNNQTEYISIFNADFLNVLNITGAKIAGTDTSDFTISNNTCGTSVASGAFCEIDVTSTASGNGSAVLNLTDDGLCSPQQTSLSGGSAAGPFTLTILDTLTFFNGGYQSYGGTITSTPAGINCGSAGGANVCSYGFPAGTTVSLAETPDSNGGGNTAATFLGWGETCSGTGACSLTLNADAQVAASFAEPLQVAVNGTGTGTVTGTPGGLNCKTSGGICSASLPWGTSVTLTATPDPPYGFLGWSGACSGDPCTFAMNINQQVTATFNPFVKLTVTTGGGGAGTVTSTPTGITCGSGGSACTDPFVQQSIVTLTANPNPGNGMGNWGGACSSAGNASTCAVTMNSAATASASFLPPDFTVDANSSTEIVSRGSTGSDQITLNPAFGSFPVAIQLSCSITGPSPMPSCSLNPASVSLSSGPATSNLIINAGNLSSRLTPPGIQDLGRRFYALLLLPPLFTVMVAGAKRNRARRLSMMIMLSMVALLQLSCGGGSSSPPPPQSYTLNVTAASGALKHSTPITVTVQ